eukprot:8374747-Pyramimonas_sp.AAC.1
MSWAAFASTSSCSKGGWEPQRGKTKTKRQRKTPFRLIWESRNGAVTDRTVTSKSPKTSPHGPSTH